MLLRSLASNLFCCIGLEFFYIERDSPSELCPIPMESKTMSTQNKRLKPFAMILMLCAAITFSLATAFPVNAADDAKSFKPIGASPGKAAPVAPPKEPEKETKAADKAEPKATGVGASAGGTGTASGSGVGSISLKKMLIIGGSVLGVAALLIAGAGGGGNGGSSSNH